MGRYLSDMEYRRELDFTRRDKEFYLGVGVHSVAGPNPSRHRLYGEDLQAASGPSRGSRTTDCEASAPGGRKEKLREIFLTKMPEAKSALFSVRIRRIFFLFFLYKNYCEFIECV